MRRIQGTGLVLAVSFILGAALPRGVASAERGVVVTHSAAGIILQPQVGFDRATLVLAGSNGYRTETRYEAGASFVMSGLDTDGNVLPDGLYKYELRLVPISHRGE